MYVCCNSGAFFPQVCQPLLSLHEFVRGYTTYVKVLCNSLSSALCMLAQWVKNRNRLSIRCHNRNKIRPAVSVPFVCYWYGLQIGNVLPCLHATVFFLFFFFPLIVTSLPVSVCVETWSNKWIETDEFIYQLHTQFW